MNTITLPSPASPGRNSDPNHSRSDLAIRTQSLISIRPRSRVAVRQDVLICNDCSPSMLDENKLQESSVAALSLVHGLARQDGIHLAIVTFHDRAEIKVPLMPSRDVAGTFRGLTEADVGEGTNIAAALRVARRAQSSSIQEAPGTRRLRPVGVLYSDGMHNCERDCPEAAAKALRKDGWTLVTVGFGSDCDSTLLRSIASSSSHYYFAADGRRLIELFRSIAYSVSVSVASGIDPSRSLGQL